MYSNICKSKHRYANIFSSLNLSQAEDGRHKCAACAFEKGFSDGISNVYDYESIVQHLPYSQAGKVRHKDPEQAYALGVKYGRSVQSQMEVAI